MTPLLLALSQSFLNSLGLVVIGAILTFIAARYWNQKGARSKEDDRLRAERDQYHERVIALEKSQAILGQAVTPMMAAVQAVLIQKLTHMHTPVMDELLTKLEPTNTLTPEEEIHLGVLLKERAKDLDGRISEDERDAALILPAVIKMVKTEAEAIKAKTPDLKLVAIAPPSEEKIKEEK